MIAEGCKRRGVTVTVAAAELGIDRSWLAKMSARGARVPEEWVDRIAEYIGVDPAALEIWTRARGDVADLVASDPALVGTMISALRGEPGRVGGLLAVDAETRDLMARYPGKIGGFMRSLQRLSDARRARERAKEEEATGVE